MKVSSNSEVRPILVVSGFTPFASYKKGSGVYLIRYGVSLGFLSSSEVIQTVFVKTNQTEAIQLSSIIINIHFK